MFVTIWQDGEYKKKQYISDTTKAIYLLHQTCYFKEHFCFQRILHLTHLFHTEVTNFESFKPALVFRIFRHYRVYNYYTNMDRLK